MKKLIFVCLVFSVFVTTKAQEVWAADIQVQSLTAQKTDGGFVCTVKVYSFWDDAALQAQVQIQLPLNVKVLSMPQGCTTTTIPANVTNAGNSYVRCSLGDISVQGTKSISIKTTRSTVGNTPSYHTFGAMVWSNTPDTDLSNNYKTVVVP